MRNEHGCYYCAPPHEVYFWPLSASAGMNLVCICFYFATIGTRFHNRSILSTALLASRQDVTRYTRYARSKEKKDSWPPRYPGADVMGSTKRGRGDLRLDDILLAGYYYPLLVPRKSNVIVKRREAGPRVRINGSSEAWLRFIVKLKVRISRITKI
jgi:hypothetical protein